MHTQEIACPNCNRRMWANVPDPRSDGIDAYTATRCPNCGASIRVVVGSGGGIKEIHKECLLTTACCEVQGLPDNCGELTMARSLRDNWLVYQPMGKEAISLYYKNAPDILTALQNQLSQTSYVTTMKNAFNAYLVPATQAWEAKKPLKAFSLLNHFITVLISKGKINKNEVTILKRILDLIEGK